MDKPPIIPSLTRDELRDLEAARALLENPGFTMRLANYLGAPVEKGFALLPKGWNETVNKATRGALMKALQIAVASLGKRNRHGSREFFHKILVGTSGGIGGVFGLAALPVELPVSTAIMLRSIADIARSEGHDISQLKTRLECLEVFAFGSKQTDNMTDSAYWLTRAALGKTISEAASHLTGRGVVDVASPAVIRFVNSIASRFGVVVSEELAAKALPIVGAAGGSIVNVLFIAHFQDMARGHFIVKRLENRYGIEVVRDIYEQLAFAPPKLKNAKA
jgi:EcsC protein family